MRELPSASGTVSSGWPGPRRTLPGAGPELPEYDVVRLGPLEASAVSLSARGFTGEGDNGGTYVAAIFRGYLLFGAHSPSELALLKTYQGFLAMSEGA